MINVFISCHGEEGKRITDTFQKMIGYARGEKLPEGFPALEMPMKDTNVSISNDATYAEAESEEAMWENLRNCDLFLFVATEESNASPRAKKEADTAIAHGKRVFPILGEGMFIENLPDSIKDIRGHWKDKSADMLNIVEKNKRLAQDPVGRTTLVMINIWAAMCLLTKK